MEQNGKICLRDSETLSVNMRKKFYNLYGPSKQMYNVYLYVQYMHIVFTNNT